MNNEKIPYKIYLSENELPTAWYNLRADMKQKPAPLLNRPHISQCPQRNSLQFSAMN